ncbi:hypothetical protein RUM44_009203 [Polyplax serrata]|uniref:Endonuclease/exonuclease/phosphatase domain-containing protein n=1 Tax=Polyplax serrata TaxID=468196 RepID=A0ABR1AS26_POLSC
MYLYLKLALANEFNLGFLFVSVTANHPPQRPWIPLTRPNRTRPTCIFTVMCYNVLCDKYATRQMYGYCPSWALDWEYRKKGILEEIRHYAADIISLQVSLQAFYSEYVLKRARSRTQGEKKLDAKFGVSNLEVVAFGRRKTTAILSEEQPCVRWQEVETDQFYNFFLPELKRDGYDGIFSPKSRAKTMSENDRKFVDGCAIFYRTAKFSLIKNHLVEFNQLAMANSEGSDHMLNRVMPKDNIGLAALLKTKEAAWDNAEAVTE